METSKKRNRWMNGGKGLILAVLALMGALVPTNVSAQETEATPSQAFLVTPLSFVKQYDLDFGRIITGDSAGQVILAPDGSVTTNGGVTQIDGTQQEGMFWGYGTFNQLVRINFDANSYILTRAGGTEQMTMSTTTIGSVPPIPLNSNPRIFRIGNPDGFFRFGVGATLDVGANQEPGTYEGTFTITLEYL